MFGNNSPVSRSLIAAYLTERATRELGSMVTPRREFRHPAMRDFRIRRLARISPDIEDVSLSIADLEIDGKGMPVLIRQYLKAGGRVLGFSVDPGFSNTLDAVMLADLRSAPQGAAGALHGAAASAGPLLCSVGTHAASRLSCRDAQTDISTLPEWPAAHPCEVNAA